MRACPDIAWELIFTPAAAVIGGWTLLLLEYGVPEHLKTGGITLVSVLSGWLASPFVAPVTLVGWPWVRARRPDRTFSAFLILQFASILIGFVWCFVMLSGITSVRMGAVGGTAGAVTAMILTPLYFFLTSAPRGV